MNAVDFYKISGIIWLKNVKVIHSIFYNKTRGVFYGYAEVYTKKY